MAKQGTKHGKTVKGAIFITGASGYVGQELVARLAHSKHPLKLLVRNPGAADCLPDRAEVVDGDILFPDSYRDCLQGVETIVHLAALTGKAPPEAYTQVNVTGTERLVEAAGTAGVKNILLISSIAAGYTDQQFYPYAQSKSKAEAVVVKSGLAYSILRPTVVLGKESSSWATLAKIACLPIIPLPRAGVSATVQPVLVGDVVRGIKAVLRAGRFEGETLDLGGRDAVEMREFLSLVHREKTGKTPRIIPLPLAPIQYLLAGIEPVARAVLPATAGQLSLFGNESTCRDNWLMDQLRPEMLGLEEMVAELCAENESGAASDIRHPAVIPTQDIDQQLMAECKTFTFSLTRQAPDLLICNHYQQAIISRGLLENGDSFEQFLLRFACKGGFAFQMCDAYAGVFARRSLLRRRLVLLLAILEYSRVTHERFDMVPDKGPLMAFLMLASTCIITIALLMLGILVCLPVHILAGLRNRLLRRSG